MTSLGNIFHNYPPNADSERRLRKHQWFIPLLTSFTSSDVFLEAQLKMCTTSKRDTFRLET